MNALSSPSVREEGRRRAPTRWLRSISIATRLAMAVVLISLISLVAATFVGLAAGQNLTRDLVHERLEALATAGATDVAAQANSLVRVADTLASSPAAVAAIEEFEEAFDELRGVPLTDARDDTDDLVSHYREKYLQPLEEAGTSVDIRDIVADDNAAALELQKLYSVPDDEFVDVAQRDDAGDGSTWSEIHRRVHPTYRDVAERQELVDVLLVEPDLRYVVYSFAKNADLGTSLETGPFGGSVVASAVDRVLEDPEGGAVLTDFATYTPNVLDPIAAAVSPVVSDDGLVGAIVLVFDSGPITDRLTVGEDWESSGFPPTGETFLIGSDGFLRSEPRSFIEERAEHLQQAEDAGSISSDERVEIGVAGSTVLIEQANSDTVNAAVEGDDALVERPTITGAAAFNASEPVPVDGLDWYVVAEVEREVADGDLDVFAQWLVVGAAVFVVLVAFVAVWWSDRLLRPIRATSERLRHWDDRAEAGDEFEVDDNGPAELRELVESFDAMLTSLEGQRGELAAARTRRVEMLRSLLPPQVAERVVGGDLEAVEDVEKVTVAVVVVAGLGSLIGTTDGASNQALVERIHGELDEIGEQQGLERIKVVGDSYYAACGHNRPYIDHAPRVLAFIADARDAVRELASESGYELDLVAGVDTGTVHVGITRASGLIYDVWGPAVTTAHNLARHGGPGDLLVTDATRTLLPDSVECASVADLDGVSRVAHASVGGAV